MSTDDNSRTDEILEAWLYALEKGFKQNATIRKATVDPQMIAKLRLVGTRAFRRWLAEHDRLVEAATLRKAASDPEIQDKLPGFEWWLLNRAQQLEEADREAS